jgi:hypothetical protein
MEEYAGKGLVEKAIIWRDSAVLANLLRKHGPRLFFTEKEACSPNVVGANENDRHEMAKCTVGTLLVSISDSKTNTLKALPADGWSEPSTISPLDRR